MAANHRNAAGGGGGGGGVGGRGESVVVGADVECGRPGSFCEYCRSPNGSTISHGLIAQSLTVDDYQDLLDRGWTRSGSFLYQPDMSTTCCPSYAIRLKAADFSPSKEQNRVHKRMEGFLDGTLDTKGKCELLEDLNTSKVACECECHGRSSLATVEPSVEMEEDKSEREQFMHYLSDAIDKAVHACIESETFPANLQLPKASVKGVFPTKKKKLVKGLENLSYTSNIAFQLAATLRRARSEKKDERQSEFSGNSALGQLPSELTPRSIGEKLAQSLSQMGETFGFLIQACDGHLNFCSTAEHTPADKTGEEKSLSKESPRRSGNKRRCMVRCCKCCSGNRQKLEILLKRSTFEPEEFELYRRYQVKVHKDNPDDITEEGYESFLVDTPLVFVPSTGDGSVPPCGFGSFHQSYVIDGRLVAVGVVDILPKCLSSKYLFWDPDFAFLSLGKYSALKEIFWVKENQVHCPSLQYYYLGFYTHSCSKMRYKTAYWPSELLCPLRYRWVPFNVAKPLLDRSKYVVLSDYKDEDEKPLLPPVSYYVSEHQHEESEHKDSNDHLVGDEEMFDLDDKEIGNTLIGLGGSRLRYKDLHRPLGFVDWKYLEAQVQRHVRVVGRELSERMVYLLEEEDDDGDADSFTSRDGFFSD